MPAKVAFFVFVCSIIFGIITGQKRTSPCPGIFEYDEPTGEPDIQFGTLTLRTPQRLNGVFLKLIFDRSPLSIENWFGKLLSASDTEYVIKKPSYVLQSNTPLKIKILIKHALGSPPPELVAVKLNSQVICEKPGFNSGTNDDYELISPCPKSFQYDKQSEKGRWSGVITLFSEGRVHGVRVKIILDKPVQLLGNNFAPIETEDNKEFQLTNPTFFLQRLTNMSVPFYVVYDPEEAPPKITEIRLNEITFCCVNHTQVHKGNSLFISQPSGIHL